LFCNCFPISCASSKLFVSPKFYKAKRLSVSIQSLNSLFFMTFYLIFLDTAYFFYSVRKRLLCFEPLPTLYGLAQSSSSGSFQFFIHINCIIMISGAEHGWVHILYLFRASITQCSVPSFPYSERDRRRLFQAHCRHLCPPGAFVCHS
jgi:hypothetical protein